MSFKFFFLDIKKSTKFFTLSWTQLCECVLFACYYSHLMCVCVFAHVHVCAWLVASRQESFMENYFTSQRDQIFKNVEVLIYVFDVESRQHDKDIHYYQSCLEGVLQHSPKAAVFCLVHKMDLIPEDHRDMVSSFQAFGLQVASW